MAVQMWSLIAAYLLAASVERPMPGIGLVGLIGFAAGLVAVDAAQMIGDAQSSFSNSAVSGQKPPARRLDGAKKIRASPILALKRGLGPRPVSVFHQILTKVLEKVCL
jgi:hypothetical protein